MQRRFDIQSSCEPTLPSIKYALAHLVPSLVCPVEGVTSPRHCVILQIDHASHRTSYGSFYLDAIRDARCSVVAVIIRRVKVVRIALSGIAGTIEGTTTFSKIGGELGIGARGALLTAGL